MKSEQQKIHRLLSWTLPALMPLCAAQANEASVPESATFTTDGLEIHYRIGGEGPYLLLLHGLTLTEELWKPFLDDLMQQYTVIAVDMPGHGRSGRGRRENFDFDYTAEAMLALLDHLGARSAFAAGHSAGGMTLLRMARMAPERLDGMVMIDAPHRFEAKGMALMRSETFDSLDAGTLAFYRHIQPGGDEQIRWLHDQAVRLAEIQEQLVVSPDELAEISVPTLVVWGDRDPYFPAELAMEMYRSLPESELWVVPGQGHCPVFVDMGGSSEAARIFPAVMGRFFAKHAAASRPRPH